jgi:hypothetical protein
VKEEEIKRMNKEISTRKVTRKYESSVIKKYFENDSL